MNTVRFLAGQKMYFHESHRQFFAFGGPGVYFHQACLAAGKADFLSHRHIEMLYATLTAWGMHRMGDAATKLTNWDRFHASLVAHAAVLAEFRRFTLLGVTEAEYSAAVLRLRSVYESLALSESKATVVVNSKALHHLFPEFIPPIDRQYTIRFFTQAPDRWRDARRKFRMVGLPSGIDKQFRRFHDTCVALKRLADQVDPALFDEQRRQHGVTAAKALDNAIVTYVRVLSSNPSARLNAA